MLGQVKRTSKINYDKTARPMEVKLRDLVLFAGHKLANLYKCPYKVVSMDDSVNIHT